MLGISAAAVRPAKDLGNAPPLVLDVYINGNISTDAMVDGGATSCFVDQAFVEKFNIPLRTKTKPEVLKVVDGRESQAGMVTHEVDLLMLYKTHEEYIVFQVTKLADYPIILGKSWLNTHDPLIQYSTNTLDFDPVVCGDHMGSVDSAPLVDPTSASPQEPLKESPAEPVVPPSCATLSVKSLHRTARKEKLQIFRVSAQQVMDYLNQTELSPEEEMDILVRKIPEKYHDMLPLFSKEGANQLPPHREIDHAINLVPGAKYPLAPLYDMTPLELQALRKYLDDNLTKGFITPSSSPIASPVLFVKKPGSLRFCVDYRALNDITVKDVTPLPRINESLRHAAAGKIFTKLDLRSAYNLIRIKEGDEFKTAFRTRYGTYEYKVMPFGLTNAPATCQKYVNEVLAEYLDLFCVCYLDDILIYSPDQESHNQHVRKVLTKLALAGLFVKGEKCEFDTTTTTFVGFVLTPDSLQMDPAKISAVLEWEAPKTVKGVQSFMGFANFYRRFIKDYSRIAAPINALTRKNHKFIWSDECEKAFQTLKKMFTSSPILKHFDHTLETVVETDASDRVISGVMSQYHVTPDGKVLHPVAYYSHKMDDAECNYGVGEKELLAIVESLKSWYYMMISLEKPALVYTDHQNLVSFKTLKISNRRHARWAVELSELPFIITYRPGKDNSRADALTRKLEDLNSPDTSLDRSSPIVPPSKFLGALTLTSGIVSALAVDVWAQSVMTALASQASKHPSVDLGACRVNDEGLLLVNGKTYLPADEQLRLTALKTCHETLPSGHPGQKGTFELLSREFWWPKMRDDVARYVRNCQVCQRIKPSRHSPYGHLKPLMIPQARWSSISMDFITGLPLSNGYDMILVVVDRLSKMAHFVPCLSTLDSAGFAKLFVTNIYKLHGLPLDIVSDRGSIFTSGFSKALAELLGIKQNLSTAFHPQTDGQTERINAILEQYLRAYTNYKQDNWVELLPLAEFCYNDSLSSATEMSPFFANYGYHPRSGRELLPGAPPTGPVKDFMKNLDRICLQLITELTWSQDRMAEQANKHRSPPPVFKQGDKVWLLTRNWNTTRPSKKLDFKKAGPYEILKKVSSHAYKLKLPASVKVHPVVHVSLLEPFAQDPFEGQINPPPPPVIVEGQEEWEVKEIIQVSKTGPLKYKVLWEGYDNEDTSWVSHDALSHAPEILAEFYRKYPDARKPKKA